MTDGTFCDGRDIKNLLQESNRTNILFAHCIALVFAIRILIFRKHLHKKLKKSYDHACQLANFVTDGTFRDGRDIKNVVQEEMGQILSMYDRTIAAAALPRNLRPQKYP